ncbi:arginine-specific demethylase JMJ20 [Silene latifolia]|uniref:arginine-specific demethylase JMJ20 n=1 Tax=Silene latifolia TaxID=37657 RepID=UPI003D77709E
MDPTEMKKRLKISGEIERVNGKQLSYTEFVEKYLVKNQPVILTGLMDDWRASRDWVDEFGSPNLLFFSTHFGNSKVQVADCHSKEVSDQQRLDMSVSEFIEYWLELKRKEKMTRNHNSASSCDESLLYLKDWHFVKEYPDYEAYATPQFFNDDWLNLYLDKYRMHCDTDSQETNEISCSDYRFVYMGPKGTWTPLHADVFRSYSWSANVCGTKLWLFLPPDQRHLVFNRSMTYSVYNIFGDVSESMFPGFKKTVWLECTQMKNEIIFVPSGWYHQVHNLEDVISINHNWFNAYNLDWVWNLLVGDYNVAKELIEDIRDICDDFESLCQRNLAANTGMNFVDFFTFITRMSFANIIQLCNITEGSKTVSKTTSPWAQHIVLNLLKARKVALKMNSTILAEDSGTSLDIRKSLDDPAFLELYSAMNSTYKKLHEPSTLNLEDNKAWKNDIHDSVDMVGFQVSNSKNLINLIDCILKGLGNSDLLVDEFSV